MAEANDSQIEVLQAKLEAVNTQIGQLTSRVAQYTDVVKEVTEKLAQNKTAQEKIYDKYTDALKKVYGKSSEENITPSTLKELKAILTDFNKQKKTASTVTEKNELTAKINAIKADMDALRELKSEKTQLTSEKNNANNIIKTSNDDIKKLREGLMKINESQDKHLANIDKNSEELKEIHKVLDDISKSLPGNWEEEKPDSSRLPDGYGENGKKTESKSKVKELKEETSITSDLVNEFTDLQKVIEAKNSALEDENALLGKESPLIEGATSRFADMHREAGNVNTEIKDGQKTLSKTTTMVKGGTSSFLSGLQGILDTVWDFTMGINEKWNEIDDKAFKYGRKLGMTAQQMTSYRKSMLKENTDMMRAYHVQLEDITALQEGITERTGRAIMLTTRQKEAMIATSKFVGSDTTLTAASSMDELGGSIITSQEYLATSMERARAQGLNMEKHSKNFADNMKMASRLNFKRGLSDIDRMTALTERMHANLSSFTGMSVNFGTIEDSISNSAQLQVLGGKYASNFSNPLEMFNMAKTDFAGMVEKFEDTIKGIGKFNKDSGIVEINAMDKDILQHAAKAMGVDYDAAINSVNSAGKAEAIKNQTSANFDPVRQEWLNNNAEFNEKTKKWEVSFVDENGYTQKKNVESLKSNKDLDILRKTHTTEEQMQSDVHDIRDTLLGKKESEGKNGTSSYVEIRDSFKDAFQTSMANFLEPIEMKKKNLGLLLNTQLPRIIDLLERWTTKLTEWLEKLGVSAGWAAAIAGVLTVGTVGAALGLLKIIPKAITSLTKDILKFTIKGVEWTAGKFWSGVKWGWNKLFGKTASEGATTATRTAIEGGERGAASAGNQARFGNEAEAVSRQTERAVASQTEERVVQTTEQVATREAEQVANRSTSQIAEGSARRTASRVAAKVFGQNATRIGGRILGHAGGVITAGIGDAILAGIEIHDNNQKFEEKNQDIQKRYGNFQKDNLTSRIANGGESFYLEANKQTELAQAKLYRDNQNRQSIYGGVGGALGGALGGAAVGAAVGSVIPVFGTIIGGIIGGVIGGIAGNSGGKAVARKTQNNVSDEEVYEKKDLAQRNFETTKIGLSNIKTKNQLFEQAAIATIGIHDLLISQDNESKGLKFNGMTKEEFVRKKNSLQSKRNKEIEAQEAKNKPKRAWYDPRGWFGFEHGGVVKSPKHFAVGGVVHAAQGLNNVSSMGIANEFANRFKSGTDTVPAMLTPGERVLSRTQRTTVESILNTIGTFIAPKSSQTFNKGGNNNGRMTLDINIHIDANNNVKGMDMQAIQDAVLKVISTNHKVSSTLHRSMEQISYGMFNGGVVANEHSPYKMDKV